MSATKTIRNVVFTEGEPVVVKTVEFEIVHLNKRGITLHPKKQNKPLPTKEQWIKGEPV